MGGGVTELYGGAMIYVFSGQIALSSFDEEMRWLLKNPRFRGDQDGWIYFSMLAARKHKADAFIHSLEDSLLIWIKIVV